MTRCAVSLVAAALLAAGCAATQPRYGKADATEAKAGEELASCRAESREAMTEGIKDAGRQRRDLAEIVDQCMKAKGFSRGGAP